MEPEMHTFYSHCMPPCSTCKNPQHYPQPSVPHKKLPNVEDTKVEDQRLSWNLRPRKDDNAKCQQESELHIHQKLWAQLGFHGFFRQDKKETCARLRDLTTCGRFVMGTASRAAEWTMWYNAAVFHTCRNQVCSKYCRNSTFSPAATDQGKNNTKDMDKKCT
jgi:hypothetical protein